MTDLPTYPLTKEGVTAALAELGRSPEEIAANLAGHGIKGERWSESNDPFSNYLRAVLPPFEEIYVWAHDIRIEWMYNDGLGDPQRITTFALCTPAQGAFIEKHDAGEYADLIVEEVSTDEVPAA